MQLPDIHRITQTDQLLVDYILDDLLNIAFPVSSCDRISDAVILEVILVIALEDTLTMDIIAIYFLDHIGFAKEG